MSRFTERYGLWMLIASPAVWAGHFMLCYATAAIWCARQPTAIVPLGTVRTAIAAYTIVALGAILVVGWIGHRAHRFERESAPHDADTPEDRHRFMGLATLMLSGLSALAVGYAALVPVFVETCQ